MKRYIDRKYRFTELFDANTGFYVRSGVIDDAGKDTGVDPFMRSYPALIDIGIMQRCVCANKCKVDCYQRAIDRTGDNMSLEDYESILKQSEGKVQQVALGGAGDPDTHENFEEILALTRQYEIVPNFTTSGITFTKEKADLCKKYCGAVAVSEHNAVYTVSAINLLLEAGVKTNVHYVLSAKTIDDAIHRLKHGGFHEGINAVVFLLYKAVGLGKRENLLKPDDPRLNEFFSLIDAGDHPFRIGFDSCTAPGIINNTSNINLDSIDYCEGGRFSMYIDANMNAMPCSFGNQDSKWHVSLRDHTIEEAWNSDIFEKFRSSLKNSCSECSRRAMCAGGCPICREIVLCNKPEKDQL